MASSQNYILLPVSNNEITSAKNKNVAEFLTTLARPELKMSSLKLHSNMETPVAEKVNFKVLDSIKTKGAKLVTIDDEEVADFRFLYPGLRLIPEKFYSPYYIRESVRTKIKRNDVNTNAIFKVVDKKRNPIKAIEIVAFTDFDLRKGNKGKTNAAGMAKFDLDSASIERLYVYAEHTHWGFFKKNVELTGPYEISLDTIDLNFKDSLRHFYDTRNLPKIEQKIRIGVIDTGVGPHRELAISGGKNFVLGEDAKEYNDVIGHGSHVAGIIAAGGALPGVANGVDIRSYRVFPKEGRASNFSIMKAISQAITDKCDLLNLSLGQDSIDEGLVSSIKDAYNAGILCFAANGNDGRAPVSFPASYSLTVAVSAMGRKGTFPKGSGQESTLTTPYGTDPENYIADFSNVGPETFLTAPGVGIISCFPNNLYAVMDGTSMACPAAAGIAARILSGKPELLALPRNQVRSDEFLKYLSKSIKSMGFGATFEGKGMLF